MTHIVDILNYEEGFREKPYRDSEGYPTVGTGILIGPKGASLSNYTFTVPKQVADVWLQVFIDKKLTEMRASTVVASALRQCNDARSDILVSMAYQMGTAGLASFKNTLGMVAAGKFEDAAAGMLNSKWAQQTPNRARRHAEVMRSGTYDVYKGLI